jgi:hypothetical protein
VLVLSRSGFYASVVNTLLEYAARQGAATAIRSPGAV